MICYLKQNAITNSNRKTSPDDPGHQVPRESNHKNIEESVNNLSYFDDNYESQMEDEITKEEPKTEKQQQRVKKGRALTINKACAIKVA